MAGNDRTLIGADLIGPGSLGFDSHLATFRRMGAEIVRLRTDRSSGVRPQHVDALVRSGARTILLAPDGCNITPRRYRADLIENGILGKVRQYPHVRFVVEVGNEPDLCIPAIDPWTYRYAAMVVHDSLRDEMRSPNLTWAINMPTDHGQASTVVFADDGILERFDSISVHLYGHQSLQDGGGTGGLAMYQELLQHTIKPIWISEMGINDPSIPAATKADRIMSWVGQQDPGRLYGVMLFYLGDTGTEWDHTYRITDAMADALATYRSEGVFYPATNVAVSEPFLSYFADYGGVWMFGYPLTAPYVDNTSGLLIQVFERAVLEYHPDNAGTEWAVMGRHLGREWLASQP